jgi:H3 lysine-79-specific histone-lysine N-methyltransferase
VLPTDDPDDYDPIVDIIQTIEHISRYYFAPEEAKIMNDDVTGFGRRLKRAARDGAFESFRSVVDEFNRTVYKALTDGSMAAVVARSETVALPLVERILAQIYSRTVSPKVNLLKQYENGTDNVYGELLPRFSHGIFLETGLRADDVFVDLGSGVGNVVFQAALEVGCEAWGIEQMPNPASLARAQLAEFRARTALWSCAVGEAHALEGDFLNCPQIDAALRRADVVLINNQAFTPQLNDKIVMKILDFKEGCRIVSLKSFVPIGREISSRNIEDPRNLLTVVRKQYTSGSVSWTDNGGEYFIATKDSMRLQRFSRHG